MTRKPDPHGTPADEQARLEAALAEAWTAGPEPGPGQSPAVAIGAAMGSFRRRRRRRIATLATAGVLMLGAGGLWLARPEATEPTAIESADAVAYGNDLYERVMGRRDAPETRDLDYLKRDAEARAEYLAALDHPSSFVRRVAISTLGWSGVEVPPETMVRILTTYREDLERPLELAGVGDAGRYVATALERRRSATIREVLTTSFLLAAQGKAHIDAEHVLPWLSHEDASVRIMALEALVFNEAYRPGEVIWTMLREDEDLEVRKSALEVLEERLDSEAHPRLLAYFRGMDDPDMEPVVIHALRDTPGLDKAVRARFGRGLASPLSRVAHARRMLQQGDPAPMNQVLAGALEKGGPHALWIAVTHMVKLDRADLRPILVARRAEIPGHERRRYAGMLLAWDVASGDRDRIIDSVTELGRTGRAGDPKLLGLLVPLAKHADPKVRAAVAAARAALAED